jgi:hypothetical protein
LNIEAETKNPTPPPVDNDTLAVNRLNHARDLVKSYYKYPDFPWMPYFYQTIENDFDHVIAYYEKNDRPEDAQKIKDEKQQYEAKRESIELEHQKIQAEFNSVTINNQNADELFLELIEKTDALFETGAFDESEIQEAQKYLTSMFSICVALEKAKVSPETLEVARSRYRDFHQEMDNRVWEDNVFANQLDMDS